MKFDILNINNEAITGEIICANKTDTNDCDLYFAPNLEGHALNYFKFVTNKYEWEKATTSYISPQKVPIYAIKKKFEITKKKHITMHKFSNKFDYEVCDPDCETETFHLNFKYY